MYFSFDGGVRDLFVGRGLANDKTCDNSTNCVEIRTETMKNVGTSLDHNSQLYSRIWLNQVIPIIASVASMSKNEATTEERINFGLSMSDL